MQCYKCDKCGKYYDDPRDIVKCFTRRGASNSPMKPDDTDECDICVTCYNEMFRFRFFDEIVEE